MLVPIEGTPLAEVEKLDVIEWICTISTVRLVIPNSYNRLSAGREWLPDSDQALAFMAWASTFLQADTQQFAQQAQLENFQFDVAMAIWWRIMYQ